MFNENVKSLFEDLYDLFDCTENDNIICKINGKPVSREKLKELFEKKEAKDHLAEVKKSLYDNKIYPEEYYKEPKVCTKYYENDWKKAWEEDHPCHKTACDEDTCMKYDEYNVTDEAIDSANKEKPSKYTVISNDVAKYNDREEYCLLKYVNGYPIDETVSVPISSEKDGLYFPGITVNQLLRLAQYVTDDTDVFNAIDKYFSKNKKSC